MTRRDLRAHLMAVVVGAVFMAAFSGAFATLFAGWDWWNDPDLRARTLWAIAGFTAAFSICAYIAIDDPAMP